MNRDMGGLKLGGWTAKAPAEGALPKTSKIIKTNFGILKGPRPKTLKIVKTNFDIV